MNMMNSSFGSLTPGGNDGCFPGTPAPPGHLTPGQRGGSFPTQKDPKFNDKPIPRRPKPSKGHPKSRPGKRD